MPILFFSCLAFNVLYFYVKTKNPEAFRKVRGFLEPIVRLFCISCGLIACYAAFKLMHSEVPHSNTMVILNLAVAFFFIFYAFVFHMIKK